jgi:hypothetical protein
MRILGIGYSPEEYVDTQKASGGFIENFFKK